MKKLLILADGLHLQDGVHLKLGKILSLAVILLALSAFGQQAKSEDGVIWTKDFSPYKLLNAVFSPDDQFIYATCTDIYYVIKYDLQGNILDTIKNVGGIRKFSEDGKYFYTFWGEKFDALTFEKVATFGGGGYNIGGWWFQLNDAKDIGIATTGGGYIIDEQYGRYYDSNFIMFKPSTMEVTRFSCYPGSEGKKKSIKVLSLNPNGDEFALITTSVKRNYKAELEIESYQIEIWKIDPLEMVQKITPQVPGNFDALNLKYSPDGSVLGYQHDGKLTLYSTTDYSVVWESGEIYAWNFAFSPDMKYIYIAEDIHGVIKYAYESKTKIASFWQAIGSIFLNFSKNNNYLLLSSSDWKIVFADNNFTSITDPFFTNEYKTTLLQNQTNGNYQLQIEATQPNIVNYFISDAIGNILIPNLTQNLEQGINQFDIETSGLPSGSYFINIEIAGHSQTLKFIVVR